MKPIASAIVISFAASGVAAVAAAAHTKKRQLRGRNPNQQHRSLEGECVGVPNGQWRPTPGCHGAALCMNDEEFFLYPCNEEEGFLYDEARGGCAPKAEVTCNVGWESIGVEGDSAGDIQAGNEEGETGEEEDTGDAAEGETGGATEEETADATEEETADATEEETADTTEEETADATEKETADADANTGSDADSETVDIADAVEDNSDGTEEAAEGETGNEKEKRMCNTMEERTYFKACKKLHCVGLRDEPLEDCKEMCRLQECTYEDEDEEEDEEGN